MVYSAEASEALVEAGSLLSESNLAISSSLDAARAGDYALAETERERARGLTRRAEVLNEKAAGLVAGARRRLGIPDGR